MNSNDEDFNLFLKEFGDLLNKYHYMIGHSIRISKFTNPDVKNVLFEADGHVIWSVVMDENGQLYSCASNIVYQGENQ